MKETNKWKTSTKIIFSFIMAIVVTILTYFRMKQEFLTLYPWVLPLAFVLGLGVGLLVCYSMKLKKGKPARVLKVIGTWLENIFYFLLMPGCFLIIPLMGAIEPPGVLHISQKTFLQVVADNLTLAFTTISTALMQVITKLYNWGKLPNAIWVIGILFVIFVGLTIWFSLSEVKRSKK